MKKLLILVLPLCMIFQRCGQPDPLDYADPTVGGVSQLLQPTRPTVQIPNQIVRWIPSRVDLLDDQVSDYPLTLASHRLQSLFGFLPLSENVAGDGWLTARQVYDHEKVTPYSYDAELEGCRISFSPASRSGMIEVEYEGSGGGVFRLRTLCDGGSFEFDGNSVITGEDRIGQMSGYLRMESDSPLELAGSAPDGRSILLKSSSKVIRLRYGISYIDRDQAGDNLGREIPGIGLGEVRERARDSWKAALGKIEVKGGSERDLRLFYSSLYRCYERMVEASEYGRYFSPYDHKVHEDARPFYNDNWIWDTHVALEPLMTILDPKKEEDKIDSYIRMYKQGGTMPSFAVVWGDWPAMTGNYSAVWMADAMAKGLEFDIESAYEGLRKNALEETLLPWRNGPRSSLDDFYADHGWFPALRPGEEETVPEVNIPWERRQAVSLSTTASYCDWAVARLARRLGKSEDDSLLTRRAAFYRNVYRQDKGMFWPKDVDGNWIEGVDPRYMDRAYFTENNAYTFQWDVKHDLEGLFNLMGGREEAEKKLDELFRIQLSMSKYQFFSILPDATGMVGQFAMGNEPSFHIPYIYNYLGSPWKTQKRIHQLIDNLFSDTVSGIPGDEDGGGMSAFVVFSMMGFFPVTPGIPVYAIGSPFFEETAIHLPDGGIFTLKARNISKENKYVQGAKLNGKPLDRSWITHDEIMAGGKLILEMGPEPNEEWGSGNLPESRM
ncbi:MAG: glycoside hydrolase family 92 protein [Bacteroidales bacterium]|nr:glycoside hydrolase family 92 protein [Bacteroidales bacterium]